METATTNDGRQAAAIFRMLLQTMGRLRQINEPYFARFGISGAQWGVLRTLKRAADEGTPALRATQLSSRLLIRPPSVTGVIDRLERMGLVKRVASQTDLRARELTLTAEGRKLVSRIMAQHHNHMEALFEGLSRRDQQSLLGLLQQLNEHLAVLAGDQPGSKGNEI